MAGIGYKLILGETVGDTEEERGEEKDIPFF
jgi:hypothetical protein